MLNLEVFFQTKFSSWDELCLLDPEMKFTRKRVFFSSLNEFNPGMRFHLGLCKHTLKL